MSGLGFGGGAGFRCKLTMAVLLVVLSTRGAIPADISDTHAQQLYSEAKTLMERWDFSGAVVRLQRAASLLRAHDPNSHTALAKTLAILAESHRRLGDHDAVEAVVDEILAIEHDDSPELLEAVVEARLVRTVSLTQRARRTDADKEARDIIEILEAQNRTRSTQYARAWKELGYSQNEQGAYIEASESLKKALDLAEAAGGRESLLVGEITHDLGYLYLKVGNVFKAKELLQNALAIKHAAVGEKHGANARTLVVLGIVFRDLGDYREAIRVLEASLQVYDSLLGAGNTFSAFSYNNLGSVYRRMGEYESAADAVSRSLAIRRARLRPNHPSTTSSINNLANIYYDLGDMNQALRLRLEALESWKKDPGPAHPMTAHGYHNLGISYHSIGEYSAALEHYHQALEVRRAHYGDMHRLTASTINNIGNEYFAQGDFASARRYYEESLRIREAVLGTENPVTIKSMVNLAELERVTGHPQAARQMLADAEQAAVGSDDAKPVQIELYRRISNLLASQTETALAVLYGKRAVNVMQEMRGAARGLEQSLQHTFVNAFAEVYRDLADLLISEGRLLEAQQVMAMLKEEEYFEFIRGRAGGHAHASVRATYTTTEKPWAERYESISRRIAATGEELAELKFRQRIRERLGGQLSPDDRARLNQLEADQRVARIAFREFIDELERQFASLGGRRAIEFGEKGIGELRALQSVLRRIEQTMGERAVLLTYLVTDERLRILVTTPNSQLSRDSNITAADLNRKIFDMRVVLQSPVRNPLPAAAELYDFVLRPVQHDLQQAGARVLLVSLDEQLRYVPYSALFDGEAYVAERYAIGVYTPAARYNLEHEPEAVWRAAGLGVSRTVGGFRPLPAVPIELDRIVREVARKDADDGVLEGRIWLDEAFTAAAFSDALVDGFSVVHVASHFAFKPGSERDSFLLLGDGSRLTLGEFMSGEFPFEAVDLLTLSACETALGESGADGTEIEGFGALAQNQGASAVIATLWPVADASTAELMARFYRYRQEAGLSKGQALQAAQLDFIRSEPDVLDSVQTVRGLTVHPTSAADNALAPQRDLAHPFYWAPFILMGNWQ